MISTAVGFKTFNTRIIIYKHFRRYLSYSPFLLHFHSLLFDIGGCEGEGCWMYTGCCNEVEVTGLTTDAASREGTYVKDGTFKDRDYYFNPDSNMYLHWDGLRWNVCIFL